MNGLLLLAGWLPLLLAAPALHRHGGAAALLAPLPALLAGLLVAPGTELGLPWLLLGTAWGLDPTTRVFLLGGALLWFAAALYARDTLADDPQAGRFRLFFLLAMAGNFQLILARDALGFYLGFALMGLAAYGLVAHRRSVGARRAARVYLIWAVLGELLLFVALVLIAAATPDLRFDTLHQRTLPDGVLLLLVLGFGIKLALPGLHLWLPLAYPAAPTAAAAVLSGAMINAGVLGWLQFLPLGAAGYAGWGGALLAVGLGAAFYGVLFGLLQRSAKTVLAYSSMSQMGLLTAAFGLALAAPAQAPALLGVITLYALHHGLAKGALFLALDAHHRSGKPLWTLALLVVLAASLAGAPFTSGALAKAAYKDALPPDWSWVMGVLAASTLATTLLMVRFLRLARQGPARSRLSLAGTAAMLLPAGTGLMLPWMQAGGVGPLVDPAAAWPIAAGLGIGAALLWRPLVPLRRAVGSVPPGDLPALLWGVLRRRLPRRPTELPGHLPSLGSQAVADWPTRYEARLRTWPVAGLVWLTVLLGLTLTALSGAGG